ncbi:aspartate carbamoyltransferase catalytic subunit [Sulfitobacter aestuariivivens]|uniref:Aspartate carbamoyltransferase catalytic subunit n=1 Tax=Sulfitobacter aestuariivivens TaxID=2766981 RepID=A0A927D3S4_9RHOB|nr:aspartate carbamoyltransferase catalytic subunit [Sulfitobacter aestuariivivens]MBD3664444.1 aspartate carbamoyltransferase catalytic subunit [Sulfitobacter aestuariivivens]
MDDPWEGLLDEDEVIVWQGRPEPGIRLEWEHPILPLLFLVFTGFSVFWMIKASQAPGPIWMFGLLFFGVGVYNLVGIHFWKAHKRSRTFYTLTNKRAFIATATAGSRRLKSYPIDADTPLEFQTGVYQDIWFAKEVTRRNKRDIIRRIGFERLSDGRDAYAKMRQVQQDLANPDRE